MNSVKNVNVLNLDDFERIYMLYFNELYHFAYHYVMSDDAEDLVQEAFVKMYNDETLFNSAINIRAYLYKIVKNACIDYLKHRYIQSKHQDGLIESLINNFNCYNEEDEQEVSDKVAKCISSLPAKQQLIIKLRLEGKDYNEIASILEISTGTVNTHVNRAYKFIKNNYFFLYNVLIYTNFNNN